MFQDTICAVATPSGAGALAILRVSGEEAVKVVNSVFKGKDLARALSHTVCYGFIVDKEETIDEVMVSVFLAPRTFTAENLVEISCHGSNYIVQKILELLLTQGARMAEPGEFTQRAFLNGRIDLSQAEAVADLIASESKAGHDIALNQMRGGFSTDLKKMRTELIDFTALIELELDFSEEDVEFANRDKLLELIDDLLEQINPLIDSFAYGNVIKSGIPVAIVGKPNAGKSTLLNVLLNEERAIVSNIPGTTRDTIEEKMIINGIDFRFIDTAGIRETKDEIESLGIQKTYEKAKESQIILYLFDVKTLTQQEVIKDYLQLKTNKNKIILCPTKIDLYPGFEWEDWHEYLHKNLGEVEIVGLSSKQKTNIDRLKNVLSDYIETLKGDFGNTVVVNQRHWSELAQTKEALLQTKEGLQAGLSGDLVAFHLKEALQHLGNITGEIDIDQDILGTIFGKFCIGK